MSTNESDRELMQFAAKAAGIELAEWSNEHSYWYRVSDDPEKVRQSGNGYGSAVFDPLDDDGDALRLANLLNIPVEGAEATSGGNTFVCGYVDAGGSREEYRGDSGSRHAATRRAIVRAAAEIGKQRA